MIRICLVSLLFFVNSALGAMVYDIVIYGGTSAGVMAAVQAARMHKSVILIEPGKHLGGMTSNGLGYVDVGKPETVGGLAKEYFHRIWQHYDQNSAWVWGNKKNLEDIEDQRGRCTNPAEQIMWLLEPHVGEQIFQDMLSEMKVDLIYSERLDRKTGVVKSGQHISQIKMQSGFNVCGKVFIDATYEGDLMAAAGISHTIGRESNLQYHETLNGIRLNPRHNTVYVAVDPYQIKGQPESGLLPRIYPDAGGPDGISDRGTQAYNYRLCLTKVPENRATIDKPADYDEKDYEILFRAIEAGLQKNNFLKLSRIPNGKTDTNAQNFISTDYVGMNWNYAEADDETRLKIAKQHELWQRGLLWTLQNHPRIPHHMRTFYSEWGFPKDEFTDNNYWPHQLYVRETRRMISNYVITEHTATGKQEVRDGIGMASYHLDSHAIKYCLGEEGFIATEGVFFQKIPPFQSVIARSPPKKKNAITCSYLSAYPPPTSPSAPCAWSRYL